jgi:hypothetical protein
MTGWLIDLSVAGVIHLWVLSIVGQEDWFLDQLQRVCMQSCILFFIPFVHIPIYYNKRLNLSTFCWIQKVKKKLFIITVLLMKLNVGLSVRLWIYCNHWKQGKVRMMCKLCSRARHVAASIQEKLLIDVKAHSPRIYLNIWEIICGFLRNYAIVCSVQELLQNIFVRLEEDYNGKEEHTDLVREVSVWSCVCPIIRWNKGER